MIDSLTKEEIQQLVSRFRFAEKEDQSSFSFKMGDIINEEKLVDVLANVQTRINAANTAVASSMLTKRYGFLAVIGLYSMTVFNKRIDLSLDNVTIQTEHQSEMWLPTFYVHPLQVMPCSGDNRTQWRDETLLQIFARNINEVISRLSKQTKVSKYILWENISVYIYWLYESLRKEEYPQHIKERVKEDAEYVITYANGSLFGDYTQNPLQRYFHQKTYRKEIDETVRIRKTCCLSYLADKGKRCRTCPQDCFIPKK